MNDYYPKPDNPVTARVPDSLPDYTKPVYTPKVGNDIPNFKQELGQVVNDFVNPDTEWYDEPDYTQAVAQGMQDVLQEGRPRLTRSEAEEQMHLTELRRLAEGYTVNDATVISEVLAKNYPMIMFAALSNTFDQMKYTLDTITGAVNNDTQP